MNPPLSYNRLPPLDLSNELLKHDIRLPWLGE
jgi:hypothetical protein